MSALTPTDFAKALRAASDEHENSWDGNKYTKSYDDAIKPYFNLEWQPIASLLLFTGYSDIWEWCDRVDPVDKAIEDEHGAIRA